MNDVSEGCGWQGDDENGDCNEVGLSVGVCGGVEEEREGEEGGGGGEERRHKWRH